MVNAKELHRLMVAGRIVLADPTTGHPHMPADQEIAHRALSLLAAAEANDGTTPETDAVRDFTWRCEHHPEHQGGMVTTRMIEARLFEEADELRDFARRLERERNGLAAEVLRLKTMLPDDYARADMESREP